MIDPFGGLELAHDPVPVRGRPPPDFVPGTSAAARSAACLTVRPRVESALDLCTGCGLQALLLARHSERVVATDVSARALDYARENAKRNGAANVEVRDGAWFEPVAGEHFDLIVANPPYVISPETSFTYRDGGLEADEVSRLVVTGAADHLRDGGFASVMCNWVHAPGEPLDPPQRWLAGTGCDVLVLCYSSHAPAEYADLWNQDLDSAEREEVVADWTAYHERLGIERIALGVVLMRRSAGDTWSVGFEIAGPPTGPAGDQLLRMVAAQDGPLDPADALRAVPGLRVDQRLEWDDGWAAVPAQLSVEPGTGARAGLPTRLLQTLYRCDGSTPIGDAARDSRPLHELGLLAADAEPA